MERFAVNRCYLLKRVGERMETESKKVGESIGRAESAAREERTIDELYELGRTRRETQSGA